jgi:hypothetical protein
MVASSHLFLTDVMTERPCELLHMDLVGPSRVRSAGGMLYVLVVVEVRPERWLERATSTLVPRTPPRARAAVEMKVIGARVGSSPRT